QPVTNAQTEELSKLINSRFNINVKFVVLNNRFIKLDAFSLLPVINANAGIYKTRVRPEAMEFGHNEFRASYEKMITKSPGWVDRKRAKVHGAFSEIEFVIVMSSGTISNKDASDDALAALLIHEIGHIWDTLAMVSIEYGLVH